MTHVLLLRHPESQYNAEGRWAGWVDTPLTTLGRGEACDAARRLVSDGYRGIVTSDLARAHESGIIIGRLLRLPLLPPDPRWRERHAGEWQGHLVADLPTEQLDFWRADPTSDIPGGEAYSGFQARLYEALAEALRWAATYGPLIVIAHDGVQQTLCRDLALPYPYPPLHGPVILSSAR